MSQVSLIWKIWGFYGQTAKRGGFNNVNADLVATFGTISLITVEVTGPLIIKAKAKGEHDDNDHNLKHVYWLAGDI